MYQYLRPLLANPVNYDTRDDAPRWVQSRVHLHPGACRVITKMYPKMYPRKWTDERVQNPDMKTIRVHRIPFCGQVRAKTLNSGQIGCEKLDSAETDVYNCIIKEG